MKAAPRKERGLFLFSREQKILICASLRAAAQQTCFKNTM